MKIPFPTRTALTMTLAACTVVACSPGRQDAAGTGASTSAVGAARDTTTAAGAMGNPSGTPTATTGTGATAGAMSDAEIMGQLHQANASEIAAGDLASNKATAASAKQFGRRMVTEHRAMDKQGNDLATKLGIQPRVTDSTMMKQAKDRLDDLGGKTGRDFDSQYIDNQVQAHQGVLALIDRAMNATQNAQIKALLQTARPKVQDHLTAAQALQSNKTS